MYSHSRSLECPQRLLGALIWLTWVLRIYADTLLSRSASAAPAGLALCTRQTVNYTTHFQSQICPRLTQPILPNPTAIATSTSDIIGESRTSIALAETTSTKSVGEKSLRESSLSSTTAVTSDDDTDAESPLGKDNFLSFEEWKRNNLDKYGQSLDQVGKPRKHENLQPRRQPIDVLDALGDDHEIDLDFSAFAAEKPTFAVPSHQDPRIPEPEDSRRGKEVPKTRPRSEDAGRTFKERFNYASFDCAATVLKTNPKSSGSSAVLVENKDSYMLNECSVENKFLVLELCEDILIDTMVLANFEFFSSIFRTFTVSVSDRYPVKAEKWVSLGTFEARNTREVQAFLVDNPKIWTKYVRIEFRTHYGNEFYCPVSLVRVHGTTMLEDYRHDEDHTKAEDQFEEDERSLEPPQQIEPVIVEAIAEILVRDEGVQAEVQTGNGSASQTSFQDNNKSSKKERQSPSWANNSKRDAPVSQKFSQSSVEATVGLFELLQQCQAAEADGNLMKPKDKHSESDGAKIVPPSSQKHTLPSTGYPPERSSLQQAAHSSQPLVSVSSVGPIEYGTAQKASTVKPSTHSTIKPSDGSQSEGSRPPASATQPAPPNPTVQESFFKSVQKRLQMLEANSTLSLQYIEEQSRILRDAFSKVEQRQLLKTTKFLDYLNDTVLKELRDFRQQYDQLWQSTVNELEMQRDQSRGEAVAMGARLGILADEIVFQKRMAVLQSVLVLFCIILVLFPRGAMNNYFEHPLVQNVLARSAPFKTRPSFLDTPSLSPESTRPNSSYKAQAKGAYEALMGHQRNLSADSTDRANHPTIVYPEAMPTSYDGHGDFEDVADDSASTHGPSFDPTRAPGSEDVQPVLQRTDYSDEADTSTHSAGQKLNQY